MKSLKISNLKISKNFVMTSIKNNNLLRVNRREFSFKFTCIVDKKKLIYFLLRMKLMRAQIKNVR